MSAVYPKTLERMLQGLDLSAVTVKVLLVTSGYVYDPTHDFLNDVTGAARLGTAVVLTGKDYTSGVFTADPISYTGVALGAVVAGTIGYIDTGVESTSRLLWFDDEGADGAPMMYVGTGSGISIQWPNRIFSV